MSAKETKKAAEKAAETEAKTEANATEEVVEQDVKKSEEPEAPAEETVEQETEKAEDEKEEAKTEANAVTANIPIQVEKLMQLYPQYEKFWVTPKGFVHPEKTPKYLLEGAKLYTNKYFNK